MSRKPFAYVTKQGRVVRSEVLAKYGVKEQDDESRQIKDPFSTGDFSERGLVNPPYNPASMVNLLELNTYHMRSCRVKARDVAGNGWTIEPTSTSEDSESEEAQANKALLEDWFRSIEIGKIFTKGQLDYESTGWGAVEITFGMEGVPVGMFHVPAHTIRVHRSRKKWMQRRGSKRVWFKDINSNREVDYRTGMTMMARDGAKGATTLMTWHNDHPRSDFYGVSDVIPALGAITGDVSRRDYNVSFFENFGVPAYAVFITGDFDPGEPELQDGDDPDEPTGPTPLEKAIEAQFAELAKNPHSILVLTVPTSVTDDFGGEGGKVEVRFEPLSLDVKEASFRMYRQDNRDEVLSAHGVDPYRVGIAESGSLGGTTAEVASVIYKESVVSPRQQQIESLINRHIIEGLFGIREWRFAFVELDTTDLMQDFTLLSGLFTVGAVTPKQVAEHFAARFGIDTSNMDHPALNAHYIGGQPVDIAMMDPPELPADEVVAALNSLNEGLINAAQKNGHSNNELAEVKAMIEDLKLTALTAGQDESRRRGQS